MVGLPRNSRLEERYGRAIDGRGMYVRAGAGARAGAGNLQSGKRSHVGLSEVVVRGS
jgi:hypothetical protein